MSDGQWRVAVLLLVLLALEVIGNQQILDLFFAPAKGKVGSWQ